MKVQLEKIFGTESRNKSMAGIAGLVLAILSLSSCGPGGGIPGSDPGYGPFDANGNYVEAWADNPSKWTRPRKSPTAVSSPVEQKIVTNDTPPANATPILSSTGTESGTVTSTSRTTNTISTPKPTVTRTTTTATKPKPTVTRTVTKPKPKPRPVVVKPKAKPSTRVVVKKGDTLYGLARRYGSSVSAIQRANGISGTNLPIGKSLSIPKN